jgi:hypothetical protein
LFLGLLIAIMAGARTNAPPLPMKPLSIPPKIPSSLRDIVSVHLMKINVNKHRNFYLK